MEEEAGKGWRRPPWRGFGEGEPDGPGRAPGEIGRSRGVRAELQATRGGGRRERRCARRFGDERDGERAGGDRIPGECGTRTLGARRRDGDGGCGLRRYSKVYGALERRGVAALIPAKKEPSQSRVPLRLFRYDARNNVVKCPRGKTLSPRRDVGRGRYYRSRTRDCARCALRLDCLPKAWSSKVVLVPHAYPALLRARRRHARWGEEERRMYRRHMWRSEGYHGEAKTWDGLARAVRRGLDNMKIQSYLTAAAINLKRLSAALAVNLFALWRARVGADLDSPACLSRSPAPRGPKHGPHLCVGRPRGGVPSPDGVIQQPREWRICCRTGRKIPLRPLQPHKYSPTSTVRPSRELASAA